MHNIGARIVAVVLLSLISISSAWGYSYISSADSSSSLSTPPTDSTSTILPTPTPTPTVDKNIYPIPASKVSSVLFSLSQHVGGSKKDEILNVIDTGRDIYLIGDSDSPDKDVCAKKTSSVFVTKLSSSTLDKTHSISISESVPTYYLTSTLIKDGILIITTDKESITIHRYSYNLVYLNSTKLMIGDVVKADSYLVDDEVYLLLGTKNGVHMVKTSHLLEIKYARLVAEQCSMQSSILGSGDFLLVTNCPQGIRLHRVSYDSNVTNTSYIYQEEAKAIDISPSLDSSIGAYAILYTTSSHLRLRIIDQSLLTVQDTLVDSGSRGRLIPLSRGYLVISYDTTSSTTLCKHGDIIKNNSIKFDDNVVYQPKADSVLLIGTIGDMVSVYDYTQSLETSYHISIPYAKPVYLNEYLMVLNSNQNVSPYINGYGDTDGYILRYD